MAIGPLIIPRTKTEAQPPRESEAERLLAQVPSESEAERLLAQVPSESEAERLLAQVPSESEAERLLEGLRSSGRHWVWETDADGRFTYFSDTFINTIDIELKDLLGRTRADLAGLFGTEGELTAYHRAVEARAPVDGVVYRLRRRDGSMGHFRVNGRPRFAVDGTFLGYRGVTSDVTEMAVTTAMATAAGAALRESERRFQAILDSSFGFYALLGPDGLVMEVNRALLDFLGLRREDALGFNLWELRVVGADRALGRRLERGVVRARRGAFVREELTLDDGLGGVRAIDYSLKPIRNERGEVVSIVAEGRDITARRESEARTRALELEVMQAQKMESLGTLAGGIAHEINTPVQYIGDNLRFLSDAFGDLLGLLGEVKEIADASARGEEGAAAALIAWRESAEAMDLGFLAVETPPAITQSTEGVERVREIVRAIKVFSHPDSAEMAPADLSGLVETTLMVSRNQWKYVATVETAFDPDLPPVSCHAGEISQVILNLVVNAAQAIEEKVGNSGEMGVIGVVTRRRGDWADIIVTDSGCGVRPEHRAKLFDLFFTTKEPGRGTGHGLSICHSIVTRKHCGTLTFDSVLGRGTTFTASLPLLGKCDCGGGLEGEGAV